MKNHGASVYDFTRNRTVVVLANPCFDALKCSSGSQRESELAVTLSRNGGESWSVPRRLSELCADCAALTAYVPPGNGLLLTVGPHRGRLLFVAQQGTNTGNRVIYSDDGGGSSKLSTTTVPDCNEAQMVQLTNGSLLMNARVESGTGPHPVGLQGTRRFSTSDDGGVTWSNGAIRRDFDHTNCMGSTMSASATGIGMSTLLFAHPNNGSCCNDNGLCGMKYCNPCCDNRANGTVWMSSDGGANFSPVFDVVDPRALYAYSDLVRMPAAAGKNKLFGLLYETGDEGRCVGPSCKIVFRTFSIKADDDEARTGDSGGSRASLRRSTPLDSTIRGCGCVQRAH